MSALCAAQSVGTHAVVGALVVLGGVSQDQLLAVVTATHTDCHATSTDQQMSNVYYGN